MHTRSTPQWGDPEFVNVHWTNSHSMSIEPIVKAIVYIGKMTPSSQEITSKINELEAKIIPDYLFKCIFFIILQFSLHFKIISVPIYSEMNWTTSKSNWGQCICSQHSLNFLHPDAARTYFFCAKTWKRHRKNKWMARPDLNTGNFWNVLPMKTPISLTNQRYITKTCLYSFAPLNPTFI